VSRPKGVPASTVLIARLEARARGSVAVPGPAFTSPRVLLPSTESLRHRVTLRFAERGGVILVVVFGWGGGALKDKGPGVPGLCSHCGNVVMYHHTTSTKQIRLYFIPVAPYSHKEALACPVCYHGFGLTGNQRPLVKWMVSLTERWQQGQVSDDEYRWWVTVFWEADFRAAATGPLPARRAPEFPLPESASPSASLGALGSKTPGVLQPSPESTEGDGNSGMHLSAPSTLELLDELEGLARLKSIGALSEVEFESEKADILERLRKLRG
jgi:hypothetical protein